MGNLTRNPEQRFIPSGSAVCDFSIAINRKITVNGQERDETVFVDVQVWGKQAENVARYCAKGTLSRFTSTSSYCLDRIFSASSVCNPVSAASFCK
jgi:single-stranded DNA-binding protein